MSFDPIWKQNSSETREREKKRWFWLRHEKKRHANIPHKNDCMWCWLQIIFKSFSRAIEIVRLICFMCDKRQCEQRQSTRNTL